MKKSSLEHIFFYRKSKLKQTKSMPVNNPPACCQHSQRSRDTLKCSKPWQTLPFQTQEELYSLSCSCSSLQSTSLLNDKSWFLLVCIKILMIYVNLAAFTHTSTHSPALPHMQHDSQRSLTRSFSPPLSSHNLQPLLV